MSVIGIDFGNQNAVVAAAGRGGVDVILNGNSNRQNACMVGFSDSRQMGEAALSTATSNFRNTITNLKRLVGLPFSDPRAQQEMKFCPFTCVPISHCSSSEQTIGVQVQFHNEEKVIPIEAVVGMMVKHLGCLVAQKNAENNKITPNQNIHDAHSQLFPRDIVVTIPGWYNDSQRRGFLTGCAIAGIHNVQRLLHESTATALAYGIFKDARKVFTKDKPTHVMFLDMGASSYSVTIVSFEPGKLIVKTSQYDPDLGGRDFDNAVADWLATEFSNKYKGKLSANPKDKPKVWLKLLAAAEKAKKTLSPAGVKEARLSMECLMDDMDFNIKLTSEEFGNLCEPLLIKLEPPITRALDESKLTVKDLSSIEIVGGGTRVGSVKRMFAKVLQLDESKPNYGLSTTLNADEAIARGAALQSAILSPRFKVLPYEIQEYAPVPVTVSWDGESSSSTGMEVEGTVQNADMPTNSVVMFDRGSNFNVVRRVTVRRSGDIHVQAATPNKELVQFVINAPSGEEKKIRINIKQDINGVISMCSAQSLEEVWEDEVVPIDSVVDPSKEALKSEDEKKEEDRKDRGEKNDAKPEMEKNDPQSTSAPSATKVEKRKKLKRTNLTFTESRPLQWSKQDLDKANEEEVSMSNIDRIVQETADKRNELESYIYDMRDKIISDSHLAPYANSSEKTNFSNLLESTENWLYEDGFDASKSVYAEKCLELHKLGDPIEERKKEADGRPQTISSLKGSLDHYQSWLNTTALEEQYSHITEDELKTCRTKCDEISNWMYQKMDEQGNKQLYETPIVTINQLNSKRMELVRVVNPIMSKPKPTPKSDENKNEPTKDVDVPNASKDVEANPDKAVDMETDDKEKSDDQTFSNKDDPSSTQSMDTSI